MTTQNSFPKIISLCQKIIVDAADVVRSVRIVASKNQTISLPENLDILSAAEAAEYLRVSPTTLRSMSNSRDLAFVRVGGHACSHRKYRLQDLKAYIERNLSPAVK